MAYLSPSFLLVTTSVRAEVLSLSSLCPWHSAQGLAQGRISCELGLNEVVNERWKELEEASQGEQWELIVCRALGDGGTECPWGVQVTKARSRRALNAKER